MTMRLMLSSLCALPMLLTALDPGIGEAASPPARLEQTCAARAILHRDAQGRLVLGTRLELDMAVGDPRAVLDALSRRFPVELPLPTGLDSHTKVSRRGPVEVIERSWTYQGLPVENLYFTVHRDVRGRVMVISTRGLSANPALPEAFQGSSAQLETLAYRQAAALPGIVPTQVTASHAFLLENDRIRPVWRVRVEVEAPATPFELQFDGVSLKPLALLPRASHGMSGASSPGARAQDEAAPTVSGSVQGYLYFDDGNDPATTDLPLYNLNADTDYLTGQWVNVWQYNRVLIQTAVPTSTGDVTRYDYPPIEEYSGGVPTTDTQTDTFAEVMMYYHVNRVHDFVNGLGYYNDDPWVGIDRSMQAIVNYRSSTGYFDNAYYSYGTVGSPGTITFGQGSASDFTYDSSVIYHEYGHAVVNGSSNYVNYCVEDLYGTDCTQGGLNEGTADYFASTLRNDPLVGEYSIGRWLPQYVRDLTDDLRCPDDLYGEEHEDGRIWGSAIWAVRTAVAGSDAELAHAQVDPIFLVTVTTPIPLDASEGSAFGYAGEIFLSTADAAVTAGTLPASKLAVVEDALESRGITECTRFVPLGDNEQKEGTFSTTSRVFGGGISVAGLQYAVTLPFDAASLVFEVEGLENTTIYLRADQPVEFFSDDDILADLSVTDSSLRIDDDSSPVVQPGHTYYLTFSAPQTPESALYGYYYTVEARVAAQKDTEESSGCGCGGSDGGQSMTFLGPGVAVLWFRARRRSLSAREGRCA